MDKPIIKFLILDLDRIVINTTSVRNYMISSLGNTKEGIEDLNHILKQTNVSEQLKERIQKELYLRVTLDDL